MINSQPTGIRIASTSTERSTVVNHRLILLSGLVSLLILTVWFGCSFGAAKWDLALPMSAAWSLMSGDQLSAIENIVVNIRAPRVVMAVLVGAALATSGASLQGVCRNPLADPGLLGISAGAAVGAVAAILAAQHSPFVSSLGPYGISISAVLGAAATAFTVYNLAKVDGKLEVPTLLLAGVAINALGVALIGLFNYMADEQALRLITFWLMGSLGGASWESVAILVPCLLTSIILTQRHRHALNFMLLGESNARFSGIDVDRVKFNLLCLNALAVGVAVAFSGVIAFIGLVVPQINSALLGGSLLVLADLGSRSIASPAEVPIGILTSLIGAPFFIGLLIHQKQRSEIGL